MWGSWLKYNYLNNKIIFFIIISLFLSIFTVSTVAAASNNSKILFDETGPYGKYFTIYSIGPLGASSYANLLESNGFDVSKMTNPPITSDKLNGVSVLIIMAPERNYTIMKLTPLMSLFEMEEDYSL